MRYVVRKPFSVGSTAIPSTGPAVSPRGSQRRAVSANSFQLMKGESSHRSGLVARRERQPKKRRGRLSVLIEHLVKVAEAKEQKHSGMAFVRVAVSVHRRAGALGDYLLRLRQFPRPARLFRFW